jgi:hypothetical protein
MNSKEEYILCAAIQNPDEKDMGDNPLIYCGHRHHNILWQGTHVSRNLKHQGFLTSKGRFVSREDALIIALRAKQVYLDNIRGSKLFSEDLY